MSERDEDIAALRELADDEFADVVVNSFEAPEDWEVLRDLAIVERTVAVLDDLRKRAAEVENRIHHTLQSAISERRFVPGLKVDLSEAIGRRRELDHRYGEADRVLRADRTAKHAANAAAAKERRKNVREDHAAQAEARSEAHRDAVRSLTLAIQAHRLAAVADGLSPEPADRQLWSVLDQVQVPRGRGVATLTEMLGSGAWTDGER